jgi:hypothetical protein
MPSFFASVHCCWRSDQVLTRISIFGFRLAMSIRLTVW